MVNRIFGLNFDTDITGKVQTSKDRLAENNFLSEEGRVPAKRWFH